jgi:orotate phosphoribosyltransferase
LLASGLHSPAYVQCALLLQDPLRARRAAHGLAERLAAYQPDSVLSPALGGLLIGHEVAEALGVCFRFVERHDGRMTLRRGFRFEAGERAVIVEDVVTTGKSTLEAASVAETAGVEIAAVGAILDRSGGRNPFAVPLEALLSLDLPTYGLQDCPLCRQGLALVKPGSS